MSDPSGIGGSVGDSGVLDIRRLEKLVRDFVDASIASSTSRVYATGQRRHIAFCKDGKFNHLSLEENWLCLYVAHLTDEGLEHSSIKGYLSAIRSCR